MAPLGPTMGGDSCAFFYAAVCAAAGSGEPGPGMSTAVPAIAGAHVLLLEPIGRVPPIAAADAVRRFAFATIASPVSGITRVLRLVQQAGVARGRAAAARAVERGAGSTSTLPLPRSPA